MSAPPNLWWFSARKLFGLLPLDCGYVAAQSERVKVSRGLTHNDGNTERETDRQIDVLSAAMIVQLICSGNMISQEKIETWLDRFIDVQKSQSEYEQKTLSFLNDIYQHDTLKTANSK